jgi:formate dehydrogenase assembly factor FdhD
MTLVGFLRESGFNVYSGEERLERIPAPAAG